MKNKFIAMVLIGIMISCSTSTKITGSWKADNYSPKNHFKKIAVVALAPKKGDQLIVEKTFVSRLKYLGYDAIETSSFIVPEVIKKENAKIIDKMFKDRGVDAVIILSLLQIKDKVRYVPGNGPYGPGGYYGGYYGYYNYNYNRMQSPGYYEETKSIFLESNFYDLSKGKLVSSIQTETVDPVGIDDLSLSFSETILRKLINQKIIENKNSK